MPDERQGCQDEMEKALAAASEALAALAAAADAVSAYNREYDRDDDPYSEPDPPDQRAVTDAQNSATRLDRAEDALVDFWRHVGAELGGNCQGLLEQYAEHQKQLDDLAQELIDVQAACDVDSNSPRCGAIELIESDIQFAKDEWEQAHGEEQQECDALFGQHFDEWDREQWAEERDSLYRDLAEAQGDYRSKAHAKARYDVQKQAYDQAMKAVDEAKREFGELAEALGGLFTCAMKQHAWQGDDGDDDGDS